MEKVTSRSKQGLFTAHGAVMGANIIYGLNYLIAKGIMPDWLAPRAIIFLRVTGAVLIFWIAGLFLPSVKIVKKDYYRLALAAFFGVALNQIMFFEGLNLTTPINASIIMVTTPILVLIIAHFILHEKITGIKLAGVILGFTGALFLIVHGKQLQSGENTLLGNLFIFINASSYGLFLVLIKPLMSRYHPLTVMKWVFTFGLFYVVPVSLGKVLSADFTVIPTRIWLSIGYVVVFTTVVAYFLNNYSLQQLSPSVNSAYIYTQPFLATLVALVTGKDALTLTEVVASALIFTGVYLVSRPKKKKKEAH